MIEVIPGLSVGSQADYEDGPDRFALVVQACKEPYHREALGYTGRAAPKDHPEYLIARRDGRIILNLVDAASMDYVPAQVIADLMADIHDNLDSPGGVLIHCNQGKSRSSVIALLYAAPLLPEDHDDALALWARIYPPHEPGRGMSDFARAHWHEYRNRLGAAPIGVLNPEMVL